MILALSHKRIEVVDMGIGYSDPKSDVGMPPGASPPSFDSKRYRNEDQGRFVSLAETMASSTCNGAICEKGEMGKN